MKWATLLKDFKEKVGLAAQSPSAASSPSSPASSPFRDSNVSFPIQDFTYSPSRFDIISFVYIDFLVFVFEFMLQLVLIFLPSSDLPCNPCAELEELFFINLCSIR